MQPDTHGPYPLAEPPVAVVADSSVRVADSNPGAGEDLGKVVGARKQAGGTQDPAAGSILEQTCCDGIRLLHKRLDQAQRSEWMTGACEEEKEIRTLKRDQRGFGGTYLQC